MTISAQGGYDALCNFVGHVQCIDRIAVPTSVSYSVADDDSQSTVTINSNILAILSSGSTQTNASSMRSRTRPPACPSVRCGSGATEVVLRGV